MRLFRILFIVSLVLVIFDLCLQVSYLYPQSHSTRPKINVSNEPYQKNYEKLVKPIITTKDLYGTLYGLEVQGAYSISAMIVAKNRNFGSRLLMKKGFNSIALIDYGLTWGKLADEDLIRNHFKFTSQDVIWARQLSWKYDNYVANLYESNYISSHVSHVHIIPKNHNVMSALMKAKKYQNVKLNGYLVDVYDDSSRRIAMTSMERDDTNETSRGAGQGGGACEIMYVINVQIGDKFYE